MGDRIAELSGGLVMAGLMLTILVVLSGAFLVILVLILVVRSLLKSRVGEAGAEEDVPVQQLGLFGAPATNWWVDRYDQWLFRLEETLGPNFSRTPVRLFAGSMILAGISGSLLAGAGYLLAGPEVALAVLIVAVLGNGFSAWWLGRPVTAMFDPFDAGSPPGLGGSGGVIIGDPLD